jgi:hypothetical protein
MKLGQQALNKPENELTAADLKDIHISKLALKRRRNLAGRMAIIVKVDQ